MPAEPTRSDPTSVDLHSLRALQAAFRAAPEPELADLVGEHTAEFIGPGWLRAVAPMGLRILGMPGWCGKRFAADEDGDGVIEGINRVRSRGAVGDSIPITARLAASRMDGRVALVVSYRADARFPWPNVRDEFRPFGDGTLLGMTVWIPGFRPGVTPLLLHRR